MMVLVCDVLRHLCENVFFEDRDSKCISKLDNGGRELKGLSKLPF